MYCCVFVLSTEFFSRNPLGLQETGTNWTPLTPEATQLTWFHIDDTFQQSSANFTDRSDFWNTLPLSMVGLASATTSAATSLVVILLAAALVFYIPTLHFD